MKPDLSCLAALALSATCTAATPAAPAPPPEAVVRAYADAASRNALEEFLALYHPQIRKYRFPGELASEGLAHNRRVYERSFAQNPDLRVDVVQLIAVGDKVAVHDRVTGLASGETVDELTVYEVEDGRIVNIVYVERLPQVASP
ncbi:nuclear transport factor 2 family protein [Luteimonas sp. M1R5S18]|uniref:Nuclear transport factor 2 family protein n=1 Tax=Luteimonas rhizosphaericola TaxID=3042024 RepID=A0ABT6JLI5_9GAMM|nr:nuclear transport factor 2 family protein [Luteimonas rhizosphaericola]MDH5831532.1 nuclear transport factor 2 family protein [Luteimonas rhizosphaericola]